MVPLNSADSAIPPCKSDPHSTLQPSPTLDTKTQEIKRLIQDRQAGKAGPSLAQRMARNINAQPSSPSWEDGKAARERDRQRESELLQEAQEQARLMKQKYGNPEANLQRIRELKMKYGNSQADLRRIRELDMKMESGDMKDPERVPRFEDAEALRKGLSDGPDMDFFGEVSLRKDVVAVRRGAVRRQFLKNVAATGRGRKIHERGFLSGGKKEVIDETNWGKLNSPNTKEKRGIKRKSEEVESGGEKGEDAWDKSDSSPSPPVSPSTPGPFENEDYDPKGETEAKKGSTRNSTKIPQKGGSKPTNTEKGKMTKKAKVQPLLARCCRPSESAEENEAKKNSPQPTEDMDTQFQRLKDPGMKSFLVTVTLLAERPADRWASEIPTQTQLIAASTPRYTALVRLDITMAYTIFIRAIAAKFGIRNDERIGRLVPSLRWLRESEFYDGPWSIEIGEENVSDVLEWLKMRQGETFVSVVLDGDEGALAAETTRIKPSESLDGEEAVSIAEVAEEAFDLMKSLGEGECLGDSSSCEISTSDSGSDSDQGSVPLRTVPQPVTSKST